MIKQTLLLFVNLKASILAIAGIIIAFLTPIIPLLIIIGAAIFFDTIFGIICAKKRREKITSRKLSKLISKMLLYNLSVVTFFCIEKFIIGDFLKIVTDIPLVLTKLVATTLLFIESKSIIENLELITGKNYWKLFKEMLQRTKEIKKIIDNNITINNDSHLQN